MISQVIYRRVVNDFGTAGVYKFPSWRFVIRAVSPKFLPAGKEKVSVYAFIRMAVDYFSMVLSDLFISPFNFAVTAQVIINYVVLVTHASLVTSVSYKVSSACFTAKIYFHQQNN